MPPFSPFGGRAVDGPTPPSARPIIDAAAVPAELKDRAQWVVWRYRVRQGKPTKVPYRGFAHDVEADATDPTTWSPFAVALASASDPARRLDGIGFVFAVDDPYAGIDLDNCRDDDGAIASWAAEILEQLPGYAEVSPSGKGIKLFLRGAVPGGKGRKVGGLGPDESGALEVYDRARYFTVTGRSLDGLRSIPDHAAALLRLHDEWFPPKADRPRADPLPTSLEDAEVVGRARASKGGANFSALFDGDASGYPSKSEADLALCSALAFWTGGAVDVIDRLFRQSGLCDAKWTEREDYRERTLAKACDRTDFYTPSAGTLSGPQVASVIPAAARTDPEAGLLDIATAADLRAAQAGISWLWEGWIQRSVLSLLAAEPGKGKTRFCMDLARRLALGLPWPDGSDNPWPVGTPTLWIAADNQHAELADLPELYGFDPGLLYLNTSKADLYGGTDLSTVEQLATLEWNIRCVGPGLVFIDTITNTSDLKSHDTSDAKKQYKPLQEIAKRTNAAIMCVTHLNAGGKTVGRRADEKVRTAIRLEQPDPDGQPNRRKLYISKSNHVHPPALGITMGDHGNEYDTSPPIAPDPDAPAAGPKVGRVDEAVAFLGEALRRGPVRVSVVRTLAEDAGYSTKTLYAARDRAGVREYPLEGRKWWELADEDDHGHCDC